MEPLVKAKAYIQGGRLYIMGTSQGAAGNLPFLFDCGQVEEGLADGIIDVSKMPESIEKLVKENEQKMADEIELQQIKVGAENTVTRARLGDQNAMAMLVSVRNAAKSGKNPRAELSYTLMVEFAQGNPYDATKQIALLPDTLINREIVKQERTPNAISAYTPGVQNLYALAVLLADGELLTRNKLDILLSTFATEEEKRAFKIGVSYVTAPDVIANVSSKLQEYELDALKTGCCVGLARRLQMVRHNAPIKVFSPIAAWELGEN